MERGIEHATSRLAAWLAARAASPPMLVLLDYDGTLSPIVGDPAAAVPGEGARESVRALAARDDTRVAVISGRALSDVRSRLDVPGVVYAGNHGLEIEGAGVRVEQPAARAAEPALRECRDRLRRRFSGTPGVLVEDKRLTLSVHYRQVPESEHEVVRRAAREVCADMDRLRVTEGKRVVEIRPDIDCDKGRAAWFIIEALGIAPGAPVLFIGDDTTDEDAFRALAGRGHGIVVGDPPPADTAAAFFLRSTPEVVAFLRELADSGPPRASRRAGTAGSPGADPSDD